jgi:CrcB protein
MRDVLWVGAGGFLGAVARYWVGGWVSRRMGTSFPYGTLVINVSGSFVLGLIMGLLDGHALVPAVRLAMAIGFVGAYTTFSTFSYETMQLLESGAALLAGANVIGSVLAGLAAVVLGLAAGRGL